MTSYTPKTTRGVQEADVWAAADALIAQGQRPTIERVRQHIGRGSPNTVSPMLESWFATLGARLGGHPPTHNGYSNMPAPVLDIAQSVWDTALEQAHQVAQQSLAEREAVLNTKQVELDAVQAKLMQQEESLRQQKSAMDAALQLAQAQRADLSHRLDKMQQQLQDRENSLEQLRSELRQESAQFQKTRAIEREQYTRDMQTAVQERQRLTEQFAGNERRMLADIDRSRQELDKARKQHVEAERKAATSLEAVKARHSQTEEELLAVRTALLNLQQSLQLANERADEFKALLEAQHAAQNHDTAATSPTRSRPGGGRSLQRRALAQRALRLVRN